MSKPDFNDVLEAAARTLAAALNLPGFAVPQIFRVLSTAYFSGYEDGARQVLKRFDEHLEIPRNE